MNKCNYHRIAKSWQAREVGCPLDHCACGTHDVDEQEHKCVMDEELDRLYDEWDGNGEE